MMYAPLRLELDSELNMDGHLPVDTSSTTTQIDIGRVFRGKSDKKLALKSIFFYAENGLDIHLDFSECLACNALKCRICIRQLSCFSL